VRSSLSEWLDSFPGSIRDCDPKWTIEHPSESRGTPRLGYDPTENFIRRISENVLKRAASQEVDKAWIVGPICTQDDISQCLFDIFAVTVQNFAKVVCEGFRPITITACNVVGIGIDLTNQFFGIRSRQCALKLV
jgi:hypothetical protein